MIRAARLIRRLAAAALVAAVLEGGPAQSASTLVADPALVAAAKREGTLQLYIAMQPQQLEAMARRFERAYGIKLNFLRLESDKLPTRVLTELRGGRTEIDAVGDPGFQMDLMKRQGILARLNLKEGADLLAGTADPDGYWYSTYIDSDTISYNPAKLKAAGLKAPTGWESFAAKEWRGQFSLYGAAYEWYAGLKKFYGKQRTDDLMRSLAANQPRIISGHTLGISLCIAGEVTGTIDTFGYAALLERDKGSTVELVNPSPTILETFDVAVLKTAPHPNAARLFLRWFLARDTQLWVRDELKRISSRKDVKNDPRLLDPKVRYVVSNPADSANYADDRRDFNALFNIPE